jgi:predicted cobalt transporter CbtA
MMPSTNAALFLFLAALSVAVFAFLSIVVWLSTQAGERKARDRFALLKTLAENPGENAQRVLQLIRDEDDRKLASKDQEERKGFLVGGMVLVAIGIGLGIMMETMTGKSGSWTVGLMMALMGVALLPFGLSRRTPGGPEGGR